MNCLPSCPRPSSISSRCAVSALAFSLALLAGCATPPMGVSVRQGREAPAEVPPGSTLLPGSAAASTLAPLDKIRVQVLRLAPTSATAQPITQGDTLAYTLTLNTTEYRLLRGDELTVRFSADAKLEFTPIVRPDGKITLGTFGEVAAAGKTPAEVALDIDRVYGERIKSPGSAVTVTKSNLALVESSGNTVVESDGTITVPKLGRFPALGKTATELAAILTEVATRAFGNNVNVSLVQSTSERNSSKLIGYDATLVVSAEGNIALPEIGFITAAGKNIVALQTEIQAAAAKLHPVPVAAVIALEPSDARVIFVDGEVTRAGSYPLTPQLTLLRAISIAGGVRDTGDLTAVVLIHRTTANDVSVYVTNLKAVFEIGAAANDLILSPQDIVLVPRSGVAKANLWVEQYITRMLPFARSVSYSYNQGETNLK